MCCFNCSTNHAYACKGCHAGLSILNHQWYVVDVIIIIWLFKAILVDWLLHSGNYLWLSHHQCEAVHGFPYHCDHMIFHAFSHPVHFNTQNLVCCDKYLIACISIYYCEKKSEKKTDTRKVVKTRKDFNNVKSDLANSIQFNPIFIKYRYILFGYIYVYMYLSSKAFSFD